MEFFVLTTRVDMLTQTGSSDKMRAGGIGLKPAWMIDILQYAQSG